MVLAGILDHDPLPLLIGSSHVTAPGPGTGFTMRAGGHDPGRQDCILGEGSTPGEGNVR